MAKTKMRDKIKKFLLSHDEEDRQIEERKKTTREALQKLQKVAKRCR
jgi:hypothetical protein